MFYKSQLQAKLEEALLAVLPIIAIVLLLTLTIAPMTPNVLLAFLFGGAMVIIGMMFFTLGAELAMEPMGESVGARITKTRKLWLILIIGFLIGALVTVSEPDLQVLADQVQSIPSSVLIISVAVGVGIFLLLALLRMLFAVKLRILLWVFYAAVLVLAFIAPADFLAVAFDAGGVTTGPMTVPFILAFGVGISSIRSDSNAQNDSFGLIALCSIGPVLAVLVLSLIYHADGADYSTTIFPEFANSVELRRLFLSALPAYLKEIGIAMLPIIIFFAIFQLTGLGLGKKPLLRICIGLVYTYVGLVVFLTGVNVGFLPAGTYLGNIIAALPYRWLIVPIGMVIGYFIVKAEPAVYVLMKQVEDLTNGGITGKLLQRTLSIGVAVSIGLAIIRVLTGISILWFVIPGYLLSLAMSFFVPDIFTAIAFDSGGVASGPMTATFLLPMATGACIAVGGNVVTDAFGVVAMVAMTPLIAIQLLGIVMKLRERSKAAARKPAISEAAYKDIESAIDRLDNYEIIVL